MAVERRYLIAALLLHGVLFGALLASAFFTRSIVAPPVIEAALVEDPQALRERALERERRAEQQRREEEQRRQQEEQERQRAEEARRVQAQEAERKLQEEQRRKREELELKAEAERQRAAKARKEAEEEKQRQDELRKKREQEQKRLLEAERQRQLDEERKELERIKRQREAEERLRQQAMLEQMAREEGARAAAERTAAQAPWLGAMIEKIRRNWQRPPGSADRFRCTVQLEQLPGGEVVSARIRSSCGNAALDRSVENAVLKASPLPSPPRADLFERSIIVTFCPSEDAC